jgi:4-hydroxyproline epimerase
VNEPRGSDVMVGALLVAPHDLSCQFGVIFFNNVGTLWMCGHGTIGLVVTLAHLGKVKPGEVRIDTAVGPVSATLHADGSVTVANVPSYRHRKAVKVDVPGLGVVTGDIAWGGNWFFLIEQHGQRIALDNVDTLTDYTWRVRQALDAQKITGAEGGVIDQFINWIEDLTFKSAIIKNLPFNSLDMIETRANIDKAESLLNWVPEIDTYKGIVLMLKNKDLFKYDI